MAQISTYHKYQNKVQDDMRSETSSETMKRSGHNHQIGLWQKIGYGLQRLAYAVLWLEPIWLLLLAPSLLFRDLFWDPWLHPWLLAALFIFWPLRLLVERRLAPSSPLNAPIYGLLVWIPVGLWMAVDKEIAWHAAGYLLLGITLYFALFNWRATQQRPWLIVYAIVIVGIALSAVGPELLLRIPREFLWFSDEIARSKPINIFGWGETINPNVLAGALLLPIPLVLALALRTGWAKRRWSPPLLLIAVMPMVVTLILAQSRGSYFAVVVAVSCVIILRWPWAGVAIGIAVATVYGIFSLNGTTIDVRNLGNDGVITSFAGRIEIWWATLQALRDYALTGVGLGQFAVVLPVNYPTPAWERQIPHAHNLFLQIGIDLGLPGLIFYCWLLVGTIRTLIIIIRNDGYLSSDITDTQELLSHRVHLDSRAKARARKQRVRARRYASLRWALAAGIFGALVGLLTHGLVDAVTWGTKLAFLPWLFYALTALLSYQTKSKIEV